MTPTQIAFYDKCIQNGCTPKFAEMLALRSPPGVKTDSTYLSNSQSITQVVNNGNYNDRVLMRRTIEAAQRRGFTPGKHDVYEPQLAKFPGDPAAFVPPDAPRHHIQKVCEARGLECSGAVNTKHRQPESDPMDVSGLGEDLIQDHLAKVVKANPELTAKGNKKGRKALREARSNIIAKHGKNQ